MHDRDGKFCPTFLQIIDAAVVKRVLLPARSPNLNAYAGRWVRSVKDEALSGLILFISGLINGPHTSGNPIDIGSKCCPTYL
jgi:hypothetical protein